MPCWRNRLPQHFWELEWWKFKVFRAAGTFVFIVCVCSSARCRARCSAPAGAKAKQFADFEDFHNIQQDNDLEAKRAEQSVQQSNYLFFWTDMKIFLMLSLCVSAQWGQGPPPPPIVAFPQLQTGMDRSGVVACSGLVCWNTYRPVWRPAGVLHLWFTFIDHSHISH